MTDKETLKLALEALERSVATCFDRYAHEQVMSRPEQEPMAWVPVEELENRCVRELREWAKANQGTYIFPGWDGNRVLKYLGEIAQPPLPAHRTWVGLTDEEVNRASANIPQKYKLAIMTGMHIAQKILKEKNT